MNYVNSCLYRSNNHHRGSSSSSSNICLVWLQYRNYGLKRKGVYIGNSTDVTDCTPREFLNKAYTNSSNYAHFRHGVPYTDMMEGFNMNNHLWLDVRRKRCVFYLDLQRNNVNSKSVSFVCRMLFKMLFPNIVKHICYSLNTFGLNFTEHIRWQ